MWLRMLYFEYIHAATGTLGHIVDAFPPVERRVGEIRQNPPQSESDSGSQHIRKRDISCVDRNIEWGRYI